MLLDFHVGTAWKPCPCKAKRWSKNVSKATKFCIRCKQTFFWQATLNLVWDGHASSLAVGFNSQPRSAVAELYTVWRRVFVLGLVKHIVCHYN